MNQEEISSKLAKVVHGGGLLKYPIWVKADKLTFWPGFFDELNASISDPQETAADIQIRELVEMYWSADSFHRAAIRTVCRDSLTPIHFAARMAARTMRGGGTDALKAGVTALVMEDIAFDFRNSTGAVVMLRHAAERQKLDFPVLITELSKLATKETAEFLQLQLSEPNPPLKSMLLQEMRDQNGPFIGHKLDFEPIRLPPIPDSDVREAIDRICYYYLPPDGTPASADGCAVSGPIDPTLAQLLAPQSWSVSSDLAQMSEQAQRRLENPPIIIEPFPPGSKRESRGGEGQ